MSGHSSRRRVPTCPGWKPTRRAFLGATAAAALAPALLLATESTPPRTPTAAQICYRYHYPEVREKLSYMFDLLGDVGPLVKGKYVTVKTNLVNSPIHTWGGLKYELTTVTHPSVAMAMGSLLVERGARGVTFCDQLPFVELHEGIFERYGYKIDEFNQEMDGKARFVNTRNRGNHKDYALAKVPSGGFIANAWEVHRDYVDTDVFMSLAKLKSHVAGGVTLGMKNLYGVPPSSLYGDDAGDEPNEDAIGYRGQTMHTCTHKPLTSVETFVGETIEGDHGYNVPHLILDLNAAFPIELVVIDGVSTISTAEGAWTGSQVEVCRPNLLIAGRNPVCTDAMGAAIMGFDPNAPDYTQPFANGVNCLRKARELGWGENRVENLELAGLTLDEARYHFQPTFQR